MAKINTDYVKYNCIRHGGIPITPTLAGEGRKLRQEDLRFWVMQD